MFISLGLSSSTIKIKAPKGKEKLKIGQNYTIKWKINKKANKTEKIKIYFSSNDGMDWNLIAITENDGEYNWDISSVNSKNCLIKIENFDASLRGVSKRNFIMFK